MIHTNLKKKFSYFILVFILFAIICVWKKGSDSEGLPWQAKEFQMPKSQEKVAMGAASQAVLSNSKQDPKEGIQVLSYPRVTAKAKPQSSFQVWDKDSTYSKVNPRLLKIWRNYLNMNKYKVSYKGPGPGVKFSVEALRCHL